MMDLDQMLSPHFDLRELVRTSIRNVDNAPTQEIVDRLQRLCVEILEPIRGRWGELHVDSGYRCQVVNHLIGGAPDSAHLYGCAADVVPVELAPGKYYQVMDWAVASDIPFDQIILECGRWSDWLHVGMLRPGHEPAPRRQALAMHDGVYSPWGELG